MKFLKSISILIPTLILVWITIISEGVLDSGDGVQHFLIAKWAFKHPELFLDHWGKPIFTILSSPFALLFGFKGMLLFNIILFIITCLLLIKIVEKLFPDSKYLSLLIPFLLISAPIYTQMILSGMTEILFGTLTIASLYLLFEKKFITAAIIASFLPFSRPEYGVVLPLITIVLLIRQQWKAIPFLFSAFVIFGVWGYFIFDDFFWFIHQHTYTGDASFYGHGEWFHFIKQYKNISGKFLATLFIISSIGIIRYLVNKSNIKNGYSPELFFIVAGGILGVFFIHSYIWWKGTNSSLGLIRVMATIIPFVVLFVLTGIAEIYNWIRININMPALIALLNLLLAIFTFQSVQKAFPPTYFPIKFSAVDKVVMDAAKFTKEHNLDKQKVIYQYPLYGYGLNIDIFDPQKVLQLYNVDKKTPSNSMNVGDILFWDAHFGPNESQLPLEEVILKDNHLSVEKSFFPNNRIKVLGDNDFCAFILRKRDSSIETTYQTNTLANDTVIEIIEEFPFLLRLKQVNNNFEIEDFNKITFQYQVLDSVLPTSINFVVAIKRNDSNTFYANEPLNKITDKVNILLPPIYKDDMLEIQIYNPNKVKAGKISFTITKTMVKK
jgi:hypothetical protein